MKKTDKQWFESIQDENIRTRALANMRPTSADYIDEDNSLATSLKGSFVWGMTPEGHEYWWRIHQSLLNGETI